MALLLVPSTAARALVAKMTLSLVLMNWFKVAGVAAQAAGAVGGGEGASVEGGVVANLVDALGLQTAGERWSGRLARGRDGGG